MSYYPEPYSHIKNKTKVELDWSNYKAKSHVEKTAGFDTLSFAEKAHSAHLKSDVDKLNTVPSNLS